MRYAIPPYGFVICGIGGFGRQAEPVTAARRMRREPPFDICAVGGFRMQAEPVIPAQRIRCETPESPHVQPTVERKIRAGGKAAVFRSNPSDD